MTMIPQKCVVDVYLGAEIVEMIMKGSEYSKAGGLAAHWGLRGRIGAEAEGQMS